MNSKLFAIALKDKHFEKKTRNDFQNFRVSSMISFTKSKNETICYFFLIIVAF